VAHIREPARGEGIGVKLAREYDSRLAEEVRARLEAAPVEEFVVRETYEDALAETRIVGKVLFRGLVIPENRGEMVFSWSAVISEDDRALTFIQRYADGGAFVETHPPTMPYAVATEEDPGHYQIQTVVFVAAARLLGLPYPGAKGGRGGRVPVHRRPCPRRGRPCRTWRTTPALAVIGQHQGPGQPAGAFPCAVTLRLMGSDALAAQGLNDLP